MKPRDHSERNLLVVGRIVAPRGVAGELKVGLDANDLERFTALRRVYLGEQRVPHAVRQARVHLGQGLLLLEQIDTREAAEEWRGALVYVAAEETLPLEQDEYRVDDIIGMRVVTVEGETLGAVADIIVTGANDVYVVRGEQGEILLPAIKQVILAVDPKAALMTVKLLEGLR